MLRSLTAILLLLALGAGVDAAKRKKRKAKARTEKTVKKDKKKKPEEKQEEATVAAKEEIQPAAANASDEMEAYRAIQKREQCTVQDLADLSLMYRGEYGKISSPEKRLARARELKIIQSQKGSEILERGMLAYAIMNIYKPESGVLFWLTGWERYAMRDVQEAGIMPNKATINQHISGEQLMGTITAAEEYVDHKKKWGNEK